MSEAQNERTSRNPNGPTIDAFCDSIREGLHEVADFLTPPESALDHFRESRIEMLKGMKDILDSRIDRLSRRGRQGARVTVE